MNTQYHYYPPFIVIENPVRANIAARSHTGKLLYPQNLSRRGNTPDLNDHINDPQKGIKIYDSGDYDVVFEDPRGFKVSINPYNVSQLLKHTD